MLYSVKIYIRTYVYKHIHINLGSITQDGRTIESANDRFVIVVNKPWTQWAWMGKNIEKYYYYLDYKNYYWNKFRKKKYHKYKLITLPRFPPSKFNATDFTCMKHALTRFETPPVAYRTWKTKQNAGNAMQCLVSIWLYIYVYIYIKIKKYNTIYIYIYTRTIKKNHLSLLRFFEPKKLDGTRPVRRGIVGMELGE